MKDQLTVFIFSMVIAWLLFIFAPNFYNVVACFQKFQILVKKNGNTKTIIKVIKYTIFDLLHNE